MMNLDKIFGFINLADFLGGKHCLRKDHREDLCTVEGRKEEESIIYPRWKTVGDLSTVTDWGRPKANQADNDMGRYKRMDGRTGKRFHLFALLY